jgi:hypothetical protein
MAVRLSALSAGRFLPPGRFLVLLSFRGWVDPRAIVRLEGLGKLKNSTSSGTRTGDLQAWRIVPQPTTLPRAPPPNIFKCLYLLMYCTYRADSDVIKLTKQEIFCSRKNIILCDPSAPSIICINRNGSVPNRMQCFCREVLHICALPALTVTCYATPNSLISSETWQPSAWPYRADWRSGNTVDSYSGGGPFEYLLELRLSCLKSVFVFPQRFQGNGRTSTSVRPRPLPSKFLPVHLSFVILHGNDM